METVYCIPCSYGQHDEHIEMIEVPAPGVMGGARCPCKGECVERAPQPEPRQEDQVLREKIADELARNDDCGPGPVSRQEYLDDAEVILSLIRTYGGTQEPEPRQDELEAVARALTDCPDEWDEHDEGDKDVFRRMARDAIAALDAARQNPEENR